MVKGPDGILGDAPDGKITPEERAEYQRQLALESEGKTPGSDTGGTGKVGWLTNTRGDAIVQFRDVNWAKNYMNPQAAEYPWLVTTYNQVKAAGLTSSRSPQTWWAKVVDQAYASGITPFQMAKTYSGDTAEEGATPTGGLSSSELARLKETKLLLSALSANPEAELTGFGLELQQSLAQFSDAMGLLKGTREINSYVKNILENKQTADDAANDMRKQATVLYQNFADRLNADPTLTVRDLVNPYLQVMADVLEIDPNNVKLTDPIIQNAISGTKVRSLGEFYTDMRQDPRFASTRTAKREAADFAQSLLKGFGFSI